MPLAVNLHIYDVSGSGVVGKINQAFRAAGTGAFHAAVEVNGVEHSYGFVDEGTGVFSCEPKGCTAHSYRESVAMGETQLTDGEVQALLEQLRTEWPGNEYDLLRRNCCHFSNEFCQKLGVGAIPTWVTNLAGAGATVQKGAQVAASNAQAAAIIAAAKAGQIDEQYQVRAKVETGVRGVISRASAIDEQFKVREQVSTGAQGLFAKAQQLNQQYRVSEQVSTGATGLWQKAVQLEQDYKVGDQAKAAGSGMASAAQSVVEKGKEARGAEASAGYQFGDLSRGIAGLFGGYGGSAGSGTAGGPPVAPPRAPGNG